MADRSSWVEGLKIFTKVNEEHPESLLWICQSGIWDLGHGKEGQLRDQMELLSISRMYPSDQLILGT